MQLASTDARQSRCLLVVAAAGYGKTSAVRDLLRDVESSWLPGGEATGLAEGGLEDLAWGSASPLWIVVDDLPRLPAETTRALLAAVAGLPEDVHVALLSRLPLGAPVSRWRGRGVLTDVQPGDLTLSLDEVAGLLAAEYGLRDEPMSARIHAITAGWPALVRLTAASITTHGVPDGSLLDAVTEPGSALASFVGEEILAALPADALRLVRDLAGMAPIGVPLCQSLGHRRAEQTVAMLARTGVLDRGSKRIVPLVGAVARHGFRPATARTRARLAAEWYTANGPPVAAASAYHHAGDDKECARVLADCGDEMLAAGEAQTVVELIRALPPELHHRRLQLLLGDALRTTGEAAAALAALGVLADESPVWDAGLAWRMGMVHYLRGEPKSALEVYARADPDAGPAVDGALLLAWTATAWWMLGDADRAVEAARRGCERAAVSGDPRARATAHVSFGLCLSLVGDLAGVEEQYGLALRFAETACDIVQVTRIHLNRSHHLLAEARFDEALRVAGLAVRSAEHTGPPGMLAVALCNEGEALTRLGRFDDAVASYERVVLLARRLGSRRAASALAGMGEVHRRRGEHEQSRACYEEAVRLARTGGERQSLVPALAGLARALASTDPDAALALADEAYETAAGSYVVPATLARGWVLLEQGRREEAAGLAELAAQTARDRRERARLADTLELRAAASACAGPARAALAEAYGIWRDGGAAVDADRMLVALGQVPDASTEDRLGAMLAADRLAAAGAAAGLPGAAEPGLVVIRALGQFEVWVGDQQVPASAWQSRKARDLLRILVARRGRRVPRSELAELLWPEDDPTRTGHRLSVLLSIIRTAVHPDVVVADQSSVALDLNRSRIDVEHFLADVAHGLRLRDRGALAEARRVLVAVERSYAGEAFSDEPYADWTVPLREEVRAAYLRAVRALAELCRIAGETELAVSYLRRLLEQDPYDETVHRTIVEMLAASGRHGEARRAFIRYAEAMSAIGVPLSAEAEFPRLAGGPAQRGRDPLLGGPADPGRRDR